MNTASYFLGCSVGLLIASVHEKSDDVWFWAFVTVCGFVWMLWDSIDKENRMRRLTREVMLKSPELWRHANMIVLYQQHNDAKSVIAEIDKLDELLKKIEKAS